MTRCIACDAICQSDYCEKCTYHIRMYNSDYNVQERDNVLDQELIEEFLKDRESLN